MRLLTTFLAVATLVCASPANAACCRDGEQAAIGVSKAGDKIVEAIAETTAAVVQWAERINTTIASSFGKVVADIQRQTASLRTMKEGGVAVQAQLFIDKARADAQVKYELSPRVCFETAGGAANTTGTDSIRDTVNDLSRDFARRTLFTPSTTAAVSQIYDTHTSKYCSQQDAELGRCNQVATVALQNADIRADAMLYTLSYTPEQIAAARAFVNNVANPVPTQNIPRNWEKTEQGKTFIAGQYIGQARTSVVANSLNTAIAARTPVKDLGTSAMLNKADVSPMELIASHVRGRFESPIWYKLLAGLGLENLWREMVKQQALEARLDLNRFYQNERIEQILSTQLAIDVQRDSEERRREARRVAGEKP